MSRGASLCGQSAGGFRWPAKHIGLHPFIQLGLFEGLTYLFACDHDVAVRHSYAHGVDIENRVGYPPCLRVAVEHSLELNRNPHSRH